MYLYLPSSGVEGLLGMGIHFKTKRTSPSSPEFPNASISSLPFTEMMKWPCELTTRSAQKAVISTAGL